MVGRALVISELVVIVIVFAKGDVVPELDDEYDETQLLVPDECSDHLYCEFQPDNYQDKLKEVEDIEHLSNDENIDRLIDWKDYLDHNYTGEDDCGSSGRYQKLYAVRQFKSKDWELVIQTEKFTQLIWIETCEKVRKPCFTKATHNDGTSTECFQEIHHMKFLVADDDKRPQPKEFVIPSYCYCKEFIKEKSKTKKKITKLNTV